MRRGRARCGKAHLDGHEQRLPGDEALADAGVL
jgi:hypothetical protein